MNNKRRDMDNKRANMNNKRVIIAGLINVETTVKVHGFPIPYFPIDFTTDGISTGISGVGYNLARAFQKLGDQVAILSYTGEDEERHRIERELGKHGIDTKGIKKELKKTPQSLILYDLDGRRQCYCDLKDIQEHTYQEEDMIEEFAQADLLCACNINFSRPLLQEAKKRNICIATDVHVIGDIEDEYNKEFMEAADILFLSDENISDSKEEFMIRLKNRYSCKIIIMGLGKEGALLYSRENDELIRIGAVTTRNVINTVGAGDSLFSSFLHCYIKGMSAIDALKYAITFASYKIGDNGGAVGFLTEEELFSLSKQLTYDIKGVKVDYETSKENCSNT